MRKFKRPGIIPEKGDYQDLKEISGRRLTEEEVDALYEKEPQMENPYYPKEILKVVNEVVTFFISVKEKDYICVSSPHGGGDIDVWYDVTEDECP